MKRDTESSDALQKQINELQAQAAAAQAAKQVDSSSAATLQAALAYAQSILDTVREPMLVLDSTLHVRTASRAFCSAFGVAHEETEGQFIYNLGNGQWNVPALRLLLEGVLNDGQDFRDFKVIHDFPQLGPRVMLINARKLWTEEDDSALVLMAIEDVTERKRIHEELVSSNEAMQRFAYTAAHDLRTPLNAALNLTQILATRVEQKLDLQEREMLRLSITSLQRLDALMNDILTYSEMGNAPQQLRLISLNDPLELALANLKHHIDQNGATILVGNLPQVRTDPTQIAMLFQNLIGNAIKYRRAEPPQIRIDAAPDVSGWRISVADNGQGFNMEYVSAIFEPFKRLHEKTIKGSGIGLATCKRIVERSGGRIWAESTPGQGSTFFFTIPADLE